MLFSLLSSGDMRSAIIQILLTLPVVLFALSFHEAAHAFAAYKMGDRTAFNLGRMTFNPLKHLDPIGFLFMAVFGYGWAKPVPINARNFNNPKKGMAWTAIAGPIANLILGVISTFFLILTNFITIKFFPTATLGTLTGNVLYIVSLFFQLSALYNFILMVFNLIPVPPFDGSRFAALFLPTKWYFKIMRYERYSLLAVLALSLILSRVFGVQITTLIAKKIFYFFANPMWKLFMSFL